MNKKIPFYKKKPFYIVLIVIFSLLLLFDIGIGLFAPSMNMGFGGKGDFSQMPEGMDFGDMEFPDNMETPEGQNPFGEGEIPSFEDMPSRGDGSFSEGDIPSMGDGSFPGGSFPGGSSQVGGSRPASMGLLQLIKSNWVFIAVILAILDGISIFMLFRIKKNGKNNGPMGGSGTPNEPLAIEVSPREYPEWVKKIMHKNTGKAVIAVLLVLVVVVSFLGGADKGTTEVKASVYEGTVEKGDITKVVSGTGTLMDDTAETVDLPNTVEITERYVSNGDAVSAGQKIAQVDKVSVMQAIAEIQEKLTELDEELEEKEDETISSNIKATTNGKVKAIYVESGESVVDAMYEHGALMLISLDGMMAVSFETEEDIHAGDAVSVTTEDGDVLDGKVQSLAKGKVVVTVSDDLTEYAEQVNVSTEEGVVLGSGELYIHSELKVTGYAGTVSAIKVALNKEVDKGDTLLKLDNTEYKGEYETLLLERRELENMMKELIQIYQEGYLYAEIDGIIKNMEESIPIFTEVESTSNEETSASATKAISIASARGGIVATSVYIEGELPGISTQPENTTQPENIIQSENTTQQGNWNQQGQQDQQNNQTQQGSSGSSNMDLGSVMQGNTSGMGELSIGAGTDLEVEEVSNYSVSTTNFVSIVPQDKLTIAVTVDEMDILSVMVGQETEITLDAFPGQSFAGTVSTVDYNGKNSGGSTKYTVNITMDRGENMLDGMNAAVSIIVDKTEQVLLVPVECLIEDESGVYVYTQYDEKKEAFTSPVSVTTGVSDGTYVEILSGLEEGNRYWYSSLDTL